MSYSAPNGRLQINNTQHKKCLFDVAYYRSIDYYHSCDSLITVVTFYSKTTTTNYYLTIKILVLFSF